MRQRISFNVQSPFLGLKISKIVSDFFKGRRLFLVIFTICLTYWAYLFEATEMDIVFDASVYDGLGKLLHSKGWVEYFRSGPHREPLYPLLIATSMRIADLFIISYQSVQKIMQIGILFVTQLLTLVILRKLYINKWIQASVILYLGFSPAILNSALSMYSEIATYPFVLGIVLSGVYAWRALQCGTYRGIIYAGLWYALMFLGVMFVRVVYYYVFYISLIPFYFLFFTTFKRQGAEKALRPLLLLVIVIACVQLPVNAFKSLNQKYNGLYEFTDRYAPHFYGNAVQRTKPLSGKTLLVYLSSVPGEGTCKMIFSEEECRYVHFLTVDNIYGYEVPKLLAGIPKQLHNKKTMEAAFNHIWTHPLRYLLVTLIVSGKTFFWESTQLGNVLYPGWLRTIYDGVVFKNAIRFGTSFLTIAALAYVIFWWFLFIKSRRAQQTSGDSERFLTLSFILLIVLGHTAVYSLSYVLTRFALPLTSLFLINIAFLAQILVFEKGALAFTLQNRTNLIMKA